jgi:hypothetical protein
MAISVLGRSLSLLQQQFSAKRVPDATLAEAGSEALSLVSNEAFAGVQDIADDTEFGAGFTNADATVGTSLNLQPGLSANWANGDNRTCRVFGRFLVGAGATAPEEGAEDAIDVQLWDLEGEVLAKSEEGEAAGGGLDVAEGAATFTIQTPVLRVPGTDGFRVVLVNRPTGDEAADGEAATFDIKQGDLVILPGN